jgi:GTP cyclohydrolase I
MARRKLRGSRAESASFDLPAMRAAMESFLRAAGFEVEGTELASTPDRAARAFRESFLDGYEADPARIFAEAYPATDSKSDSVLLKGISFHGLCPHHLLPYRGVAHLSYVPKKKLASLSSLARVVDCYAHRLEIQETVTRQIGDAVQKHLGAEGVAVVLDTDQTCMTMRRPERRGVRTITRHFTGVFARKSDLRLEFLESLR